MVSVVCTSLSWYGRNTIIVGPVDIICTWVGSILEIISGGSRVCVLAQHFRQLLLLGCILVRGMPTGNLEMSVVCGLQSDSRFKIPSMVNEMEVMGSLT